MTTELPTGASYLKVRAEVQVVNHSGTLEGMVGVIDEITDEDHVLVVMEDLWGRHAIRQDQLQLFRAEAQRPAAQKSAPVSPRSLPIGVSDWRDK